jgi:tyrosine-protein kinase Etk/Wzc
LANDMDLQKTPVPDGVTGEETKAAYQEEEEEISILDLLLILAARKGLVIGLTLLGGIMAAVIAFLIPPTYTATAVIMPPQQQSSSAAALLGQLGGVAGLASQSLGIKSPADLYIGLLSSRTIADELIKQFGLQNVYRTKDLTDTRKKLASRTSFSSAKSSLIQISVEEQDRKRAADLANAYVDRLQEQNSRLAVTEASQRRLFFERQLEAEKNNLAEAEAAFKKMQEQKGIFQVSSQVEAVIRSMVQMHAEVAAREVILQRLKAGATTQNPEVQRQEIELKALRTQLQELESSRAKRSQGDPLMSATMVPEAGLEYTRRLREVKYRETLYELLARQYEAARIDEAKESPVIQIVDPAIPPDRKSGPKRLVYAIMGLFTGGILGIIAALFLNTIQHSEQNSKVESLMQLLWLRRKKGDFNAA